MNFDEDFSWIDFIEDVATNNMLKVPKMVKLKKAMGSVLLRSYL